MKITKELISDLLATALEGGSNYWCILGDYNHRHFVKGHTLADNLAMSFELYPNYKVEVMDVESVEYDDDDDVGMYDTLGHLTNEGMAHAFDVMASDYPHAYARIKTGDYDADDSDVWFQIATMGEVVFG